MRDERKSAQWLLLFLVLSVVALNIYSRSKSMDVVAPTRASSRIMMTAAHIPPTEFPECILIYSDEETDVAIYFDPRYEAQHVPDNSPATYAGLTGTVEYSDGNNFYLIPDDPNSTVKGLSGKPVYVDGVPIGFVSALVSGGKLRCVYY